MADEFGAEIVESPITTERVEAAMSTLRDSIGLSGPIVVTSFNRGFSILLTGTLNT